jgi:hypothetical protein
MDALTLAIIAVQQPHRGVFYEDASDTIVECAKCADLFIQGQKLGSRVQTLSCSRLTEPGDEGWLVSLRGRTPAGGETCNACGEKVEHTDLHPWT